MRKSLALGVIAVLFLAGCSSAAKQTEKHAERPPTAAATASSAPSPTPSSDADMSMVPALDFDGPGGEVESPIAIWRSILGDEALSDSDAKVSLLYMCGILMEATKDSSQPAAMTFIDRMDEKGFSYEEAIQTTVALGIAGCLP